MTRRTHHRTGIRESRRDANGFRIERFERRTGSQPSGPSSRPGTGIQPLANANPEYIPSEAATSPKGLSSFSPNEIGRLLARAVSSCRAETLFDVPGRCTWSRSACVEKLHRRRASRHRVPDRVAARGFFHLARHALRRSVDTCGLCIADDSRAA